MNLGLVARELGRFARFFALAQLVPLAWAIISGEGESHGIAPALGFAAAAGIGLVASALLSLSGRLRTSEDFYRRESIAVVGLAWLLASALGGLPFVWSGALHSAADAFFETASGLTTTGASVFGSGGNPAVEDLPRSVLLWRAILQWIGGLGVIFVFLVFLPGMGVTGKSLLSSEQIGVSSDHQRPRMADQARMLLRVYGVLTLAQTLALVACGVETFDAICHAFTTLATGGFSTRNHSIGAYHSLSVELVTILFMFLAGCNFLLLHERTQPRSRKPGPRPRDREFLVYTALTASLIVLVTLLLWGWGESMVDRSTGGTIRDYGRFETCLRDAAFQVVSILTSTGFSTADFQNWPKPILLVLMFCMLVGGCTGSTAGGIKVLRLTVVAKLLRYNVLLYIRPRAVEKIKVGEDTVPDSVVSSILALVLFWIAAVAAGAFLIALGDGVDLVSAVSASLSMMGCTGPAITEVLPAAEAGSYVVANAQGIDLGPFGGYGQLQSWTKTIMALQMILGRLELMTLFVLVLPRFWRR